MTPEERKAAIQEALKKRNAKAATVEADKSKASIIQSEKEKRGYKKAKNYGTATLHD